MTEHNELICEITGNPFWMLHCLRGKNAKVVVLERFGFNGRSPKSLRAIGRLIGISPERVRQTLVKSLRRLRAEMHAQLKKHDFEEFSPLYRDNEKFDYQPVTHHGFVEKPMPVQQAELWCIINSQGKSLCGHPTEGSSVPDDEVPNEMTCPKCLDILKHWENS